MPTGFKLNHEQSIQTTTTHPSQTINRAQPVAKTWRSIQVVTGRLEGFQKCPRNQSDLWFLCFYDQHIGGVAGMDAWRDCIVIKRAFRVRFYRTDAGFWTVLG